MSLIAADGKPFALEECTVDIKEDPDYYEHPGILNHIKLKVRHSAHTRPVREKASVPGGDEEEDEDEEEEDEEEDDDDALATINALKINRVRCRGRFLEVMDDASQELHEFSVTLFNKFGHLKPELVDHEYHRGSGAWGRELDDNMLVYVEAIEVKPEFRNKGVGSWALRKLCEHCVAPQDFVVCWPTPIDRIHSKSAWRTQRDRIVNFFRKNGFRRVGRTNFFAYSPNLQHPSRSLAAAEDVSAHEYEEEDEPEEPEDEENMMDFLMTGGALEAQHKRDEKHAQRYPVHHAIAESMHPGSANIGATIRTVYAVDPTSVRKKDNNGLTPLHLAAGLLNLPAVEALLALPVESGVREDLTRRDNLDGVTPVEACERMMRSTKEFSETMLGRWDGQPDEGLKIVAILRRAAGEHDLGTDEEYARQRKWGCTCGQCADGWLSPRMRFRLQCEAESYADMMETSRPPFQRGQRLSEMDILGGSVALDFVPRELWGSINRGFYNGMQLVVQVIGVVLKQPGSVGIPRAQYVRQRMGDMANAFFSKGGRIEYALDLITNAAQEESPLGDGTWDEMVAASLADQTDGAWEVWRGMPRCANDLEFGIVREKIGLSSGQRWGPYWGGGDEDEGMMDSDDDLMG